MLAFSYDSFTVWLLCYLLNLLTKCEKEGKKVCHCVYFCVIFQIMNLTVIKRWVKTQTQNI